VSNFPTIDQWNNGIATSIKSINLGATSYQNIPTLTSTVTGYVSQLENFTGTIWGGVTIAAGDITGRTLILAIPPNATPEQLAALQNLVTWASQLQNPVTVTLQVVK
jgi:hypothetical protein